MVPRRLKKEFRPGIAGAKYLKEIIRQIGNIVQWLSTCDTELVSKSRHQLWNEVGYLQMEMLAYEAIYSQRTEDQLWALMRLSRMRGKKVVEVIEQILDNPAVSGEVRKAAEELLKDSNVIDPSSAVSAKSSRFIEIHSEGSVYYTETEEKSVSEKGDTYNVSGQAGSVGREAETHAQDMSFNQSGNQFGTEINLNTLATELSTLRKKLKEEATEPEQDLVLASVASAEIEAKRGNKHKVYEYLSKTSQWVLDTATKIGVSVAVAAIKEALGVN